MDGCQGGRNDKEAKSIKIELSSLVCDRSYDDLEISLSNLKGIIDVDLDRKTHMVFVDYDPTALSEHKITDLVSAIGCRVQDF